MAAINIVNKVFIKRPVEEVYAFAIDYTQAHRWYHDLLLFDKLTEGEIRVGTEFTQKYKDPFFREGIELKLRATEIVPPTVFASEVFHKWADGTARSVFQGEKEGTMLTSYFTLKLKIGFLDVISPLIAPTARSKQMQSLKNLKALMEKEKR